MEHKVIGKILGNRYRILREVGSGGMAWVYLAEDINEGRLVAVKVLYPQFGEDVSYIQRFNREAKLASTLSDQHVVRVLDYGATRDVHYLVMEYIEGRNLRSVIDERGSLSWTEALEILDQVAVALEHAHLHGIVHRDIKPQNLMITGEGVLKVLDFGIARARMLPSLTQSGFVGSPYYISPEQAMGEDVDIRSDIYSAGVVLYEMLSGRVPYDAASPWSIISQHIASEPPRIDLRDSEISHSCEMLMHRMIAKRPEDRFQTPTALRQAIACVLEGRPLPEPLDVQLPTIPDRVATAEGLYRRAQQAIEDEDWQRAVDLLNQVIKLDPERAEASERLAYAGRQARLAALYVAARRAMEKGRWQEAADELSEVLSVESDYFDAADLLERARAAQQDENLAQAVSDLYSQGAAHIESGAWEEAARCLRRVQQLSPGYKKTETLLAEAERQLRTGPGRWFFGGGVLRRVGVLLALSLILLAIVAGGYFLIQNNYAPVAPELATRVSQDPSQVYGEAQTAFQAGDWDKAIELFNAILAANRKYQDAATLRKQAVANRALEQTFKEGESAYLEGDWNKAIDVLSRLRQANATFRADEVQDILCDANLQSGQAQIAIQSGEADKNTVASAIKDFEEGLAICPGDQSLSIQQTYAEGLLLALEAHESEDFDTVVNELTPVVAAEPGYANDYARHLLYMDLVKRGEIRQQTGDLAGAFQDYQQALALGEADSLNAESRRAEVLEELGGELPPMTPQAGATPAHLILIYAAPSPIGPADGTLFQGKYTVIMLQWESVGALASDEYYDVTVMHYVGEEPRYWGGPVRETQWQVPAEAGLGEAANDRFYWWVTVRKADTAPGLGQLDLALSPRSETRTFYWSE
jgi:outer membrane protein assembly factor BamD (BamD/ComL family)/predicted Ser/Thr protein kinase